MIHTVLFDMGGTLEDIYHDDKTLAKAARGIREILAGEGISLEISLEELSQKAMEGWERYKNKWQKACIELKPEQIWPEYILADVLPGRALDEALCERLAHMWEVTYYTRKLRPGVEEMLESLRGLGLRMGVISNTASLFQVFAVLENYGIRDYFEDVTLSSITGYRKPHRHIFQVALLQMRAQAAQTAYVGDTLSRDVIGPREAGFGMTFQIPSFLTLSRDGNLGDTVQADHTIADIREVAAILRGQRAVKTV